MRSRQSQGLAIIRCLRVMDRAFGRQSAYRGNYPHTYHSKREPNIAGLQAEHFSLYDAFSCRYHTLFVHHDLGDGRLVVRCRREKKGEIRYLTSSEFGQTLLKCVEVADRRITKRRQRLMKHGQQNNCSNSSTVRLVKSKIRLALSFSVA